MIFFRLRSSLIQESADRLNMFNALKNVRVWLLDSFPARQVFDATEPAKLDGIPAKLALLGPTSGVFSYVELRVTGRRWRLGDFGSLRMTVRVRFATAGSSGEWIKGELIARPDENRAEILAELARFTN